MTDLPLLGDRYELGEMLGRGGMAEVRRGRDTRLGRTVAVKMLRIDHAADPTFQARFRREAQSAASLNHRTIVAVYDTGEDVVDGNRIPYIIMEYVEGRILRDLLREHARFTPERAVEVTAGVLEALEYSHRAGIVHRDIKPANVMLTTAAEVKVMDFGIARPLSDTGMTLTQTAAVVGTAQYISPEQARGDTADARSDIYATGGVLYELLTGRPPFVGDSLVSVAVSHVREMPTPPSALDPSIPRDLDAVVMKALAKDRLDRYQSAHEMREDLRRILVGLPVSADATAATQLIAPAATALAYDDALPLEEEASEEERGRGLGSGLGSWPRRPRARQRRRSSVRVRHNTQLRARRGRDSSAERNALVDRDVTHGAVVFNVPRVMRQGQVERVEVIIARWAEFVDGLLAELRDRREEAVVEHIQTSHLMEVILIGQSFDILALSPPEQLVASKATWEFDVRPRLAGLHALTLGVTRRVDIPDHLGVPVAIPVLEKLIRVKVDIPFNVRRFVKENWQWLVVTALGLGGTISAWAALIR